MGKASAAFGLAFAFALALAMGGCTGSSEVAGAPSAGSDAVSEESASVTEAEQVAPRQPDGMDAERAGTETEEGQSQMQASIGGTDVSVEWEHNQAVSDLRALAAQGPVTVELSPYGGFEQVGPLGTSLTASDVQMTTEPGDIVLYAGNQISIFYGTNSWAYTKLGHISDRTADEMAGLLANGDTSITISIP